MLTLFHVSASFFILFNPSVTFSGFVFSCFCIFSVFRDESLGLLATQTANRLIFMGWIKF